MSVFKRYQGKRITSKHPKYANARWWIYRRVKGHKTIHQAVPEARTKEQAELAERRLVDGLFGRKYGVTDTETTFGQFADEIYKPFYLEQNVNTGAKRLDVDLLKKHWKAKPISDITPQDCRTVQQTLRRRTKRNKKDAELISPASVNRTMTTASKIFSLACEEGILERNPMQFVKRLAEPPPRNRILSTDERAELMKAVLDDTLLRRLVILAMTTPMRKGQILALRETDIDFEQRFATVIASKRRPSRRVPLNDTAIAVFRELCDGRRGLLFPIKDFRRRWHSALVRAGINAKDGSREDNYHFHDLRKEFASELLRRGVGPKFIQDLFAHSDMSITNIYLPPIDPELHNAVNRLDDKVLDSEVIQ